MQKIGVMYELTGIGGDISGGSKTVIATSTSSDAYSSSEKIL